MGGRARRQGVGKHTKGIIMLQKFLQALSFIFFFVILMSIPFLNAILGLLLFMEYFKRAARLNSFPVFFKLIILSIVWFGSAMLCVSGVWMLFHWIVTVTVLFQLEKSLPESLSMPIVRSI